MGKPTPDLSKFDDRLAAVYSRTGDKEAHYDQWASSYEADLVEDLGYVAHIDASDIFAQVVTDRSARILDVACGTGLAGAALRSRGYKNIHGVDFSMEMLKIAARTEVYQSLWQQDFTEPVDRSPAYDALICVGLFSYATPKISDMHNVIGCVVPGGTCIITVNGAAWEELGLETEVRAEAGRHGFSVSEIRQAGYIGSEGIDSRVLVIRR
ncbi:MAG: methyltransferase domain-containing protein [Gammaproteobacteria bacterium]|nr:methyltransferase domain-containing protein [Gammaproteobacteria bacterium]